MSTNDDIPLWNNQALVLECEDKTIYYTRITGIKQRTIFIEHPVNRYRERMKRAGNTPVSVNFYNDRKEKYVFDTILETHNQNIRFTLPDAHSIRKVENRQYFRVPAMLELWLQTESGEEYRFITDDISGGGLAFFCSNPDLLKVNDIVSGRIFLDKKNVGSDIRFFARITSVRKDSNYGVRFAMEFIEMKEPQRTKIIQYCLKRQIEIRNKTRGLGK